MPVTLNHTIVSYEGQNHLNNEKAVNRNIILPFNLATHNGIIRFANGRVHTFRAHTMKGGQRLVQEKSGKSWKKFGFISEAGRVELPESTQKDVELGCPYTRKIVAKQRMLNNPQAFANRGIGITFTGKCRCCNRPLTDPRSVTEGIGPICRKNLSDAATSHIAAVSSPDPDPNPTPNIVLTANIQLVERELEERGLAFGFITQTINEIRTAALFGDLELQLTRDYIDSKYGAHKLVQIGYQTYRYEADKNFGWKSVCLVEDGLD